MPTEAAAATGRAPARSVREALRQVDASARALRDAGRLGESWALLLAALEAALVQTRDLTLLVTKLQRERLGLCSERVAQAQLALLFEALVEQGPLTEAEVARETQADASATFDRLFTGHVARATEVGCWAHARRPLVDLADTDCRVAYPLQLIRRLYRIERLADVRHLGPEARRAPGRPGRRRSSRRSSGGSR